MLKFKSANNNEMIISKFILATQSCFSFANLSMALFQQLSKIDNRTKYAVHGWIREVETSLQLTHIPMMINSMCILFFRDDEIFDIIGKNVRLSSNKKCITKLKMPQGLQWCNNSYGIMEIPSMSDLIYKWDLKITRLDANGIMIGISSIQAPNEDFERKYGYHYVHFNTGEIFHKNKTKRRLSFGTIKNWKAYGDGYQQSDIVSIHLNMKQGKIRFLINGKDQGIAYKHICKDQHVKYRLFATIYHEDEGVEIVNFSKQ